MRSYLLAIGLMLLPATIAIAQLGTSPPATRRPPQPPPPPRAEFNAQGQGNPANQQNAAGQPPAAPNAMFSAIDGDGDGVITKLELRRAIAALKKLDIDKDGSITLEEASAGDGAQTAAAIPGRPGTFAPGGGAGQAPEAAAVIARYDLNNDRILSADEVPARIGQMFRPEHDLNGNGAMDAAELQMIMARMGDAARAWEGGQEPGLQSRPFQDPNRRNRPRPGDPNGTR